jgi:transposase
MLSEEERERVRRAYYLDHHSVRRIARETGHCYRTIAQALDRAPTRPSAPRTPRPAPVFGPYHARVEELLAENERLPHKQRYTARRIFLVLRDEDYTGCESVVRQFVSDWRRARQPPETFLPLEFTPGQDAQVDWGEAGALVGGVRQTVQLFVMRLCYSRCTFVMAFPSQKQESFLHGHVRAFEHFAGVPARLSYDNLATAVTLAFDKGSRGRSRREVRTFVALRSHYLFESHFCTPGQGHEKRGVEHGVGYVRRNYLVPIPEATSFDDLNLQLLQRCLHDD